MARSRGRHRTLTSVAGSLALLVGTVLVGAGAPAQAQPPPTLRELAAAQGLHLGAAVAGPPTLADPTYREVLTREFSMGTSENDMKWGPIHPAPDTYAFANADAQAALLADNAMAMRGHNLAWHMQNPDWLTSGTWTRDEAIGLLEDHIDAVAGRYAGRIVEWDVVNEAVGLGDDPWPNPWSASIGYPDYLDVAFHRARLADPSAQLFYNDFGIELANPRADAVYDLVRGMVGRGVPIDGVGFQAHLSVDSCPTPTSCTDGLLTEMARYEALGLQVSITELDVAIPLPADADELARQADVYRQVVLACLWAPNCDTVVLWGVSDAHSWIPGFRPGWGAALLLDEQYQPKPAYDAVAALLADPPALPAPTTTVPASPTTVAPAAQVTPAFTG
ncbi:MAG: endo-1,4-beta-xylanase [Acidimicrobiales bacterium]|nr:endo-1,4-beta-xylanase [Acidimicrobiales bacterium]